MRFFYYIMTCLGLLVLLAPGVPAQQSTSAPGSKPPSKAAGADPAPADDNATAGAEGAPTPAPALYENTVSFLGVGGEAGFDATRTSVFEDYDIVVERICADCFCNHAFGPRLDESLSELYAKSEVFKNSWDRISPCIEDENKVKLGVRSVPLLSKYRDTDYQRLWFYFSKQTDTPVGMKLETSAPDQIIEKLNARFGPSEDVEGLWHIWSVGQAVLVYDLFNVKNKKRDYGTLFVYFMDNLKEHLAPLEDQTTPPSENEEVKSDDDAGADADTSETGEQTSEEDEAGADGAQSPNSVTRAPVEEGAGESADAVS